MTTTISLINMKGGVGKSTLAVNLAWHFCAYNNWLKNVLLVDLDPQFNASQYILGGDRYASSVVKPQKPTVWDILEQLTQTPGTSKKKKLDPHDAVVNITSFTGHRNRLDLIASRLELAYALKQPAQKELLLAKALKQIKDEYDIVIIDCAPTESVLTTAAYLCSDYVLVPVKPEYLSTIGLPLLVNSLDEFHEQYDDHKVEIAGIVYNHTTQYEPEEHLAKTEVQQEASKRGWHVFKNEIAYSRSYPRGARDGRPIFRTSNAQQSRKTGFLDFSKELAGRVGL